MKVRKKNKISAQYVQHNGCQAIQREWVYASQGVKIVKNADLL